MGIEISFTNLISRFIINNWFMKWSTLCLSSSFSVLFSESSSSRGCSLLSAVASFACSVLPTQPMSISAAPVFVASSSPSLLLRRFGLVDPWWTHQPASIRVLCPIEADSVSNQSAVYQGLVPDSDHLFSLTTCDASFWPAHRHVALLRSTVSSLSSGRLGADFFSFSGP